MMRTNRSQSAGNVSGSNVWIAVLTLLSACSGANDSAANRIENVAVLTAEEEMRIGDVNDPALGFSFPIGMDVDDDGFLYVVEASVPEIRVFTPAGELVRRIGRRGEGPGEFESPPEFGVIGDTVWTIDGVRGRLTLFDRLGAVIESGLAVGVPVPLPQSLGHVLPTTMRPDGKFAGFMSRVTYSRDASPTGVEATDTIRVPLVLFDIRGQVTDTVGWLPKPPPRMWQGPDDEQPSFETRRVGDRNFMVPTPPPPLARWEPLADGYVAVDMPQPDSEGNGIIAVTRIAFAGDTVFSRVLTYQAARYSSADLDSVASREARFVGRTPIGSPQIPVPDNWEIVARTLREAMDFPDYQIGLEWPWISPNESIWLRMRNFNEDTAHWTILDPDGEIRGNLDLPPEVRPLWSDGDVLWAIEPDDLEVPWLVRYRLSGS